MNSLLRTGLPRRLALVAVIAFSWAVFAPAAYADTSYGPPYSYSSPVGVRDGITSLGEAVQDYIADEAAYVTVTMNGDTGVSILASDVTGIGFTPKNVGGCRTLFTGGEGQQQDTNGPRGSSADGRSKDDTADVGTSLVADPINAANGNSYRQDTDLSGSAWLTFRRFYNSSTYVSKANLGLKWRHSFDRSLTIMPNNNGTSGGLITTSHTSKSLRHRHRLAGRVVLDRGVPYCTVTCVKCKLSGVGLHAGQSSRTDGSCSPKPRRPSPRPFLRIRTQ